MKLMLAILVSLIALSTEITAQELPVQTAPSKDALIRKAENDSNRDIEAAERLVIAHSSYNLIKGNDVALAYAASHLATAKTAQDVRKVFEDAVVNGSAVEFVNREQTVAAIKFGIKRFGGARSGELSKAVDVANYWIAKLEAQGPDETFQLQDVAREAAVMALYGNFEKLPPEVREEAARQLSVKLGKDFENDFVKPARENRVLGETASTSENDVPENSRPLDTLTYDDGIALVKDQLAIQQEQLDAIEKGLQADKSLEDRKSKLHADADRLRAGVYLTTVALGPIVGDREADKIGTIGNSFIKMHEAMAQFGPGGLTPDKLLMCSNMVGAGMVIAQVFVQQEDPTMVALQSIMKQLQVISEKLDQIEKKIDKLSNLVLIGFERVLQNQRYVQDRIADFSRIVLSNIRDTTQRQAILDFSRYLASQSENYRQLLTCSATLRDLPPDVQDCLKELAVDLSRKTIFTRELRDTIPRIFDPEWSNQMLSFQLPADDLDSIVLTELSGPIYFLQSPVSYSSVIARNHEAVASYAQQKLGLFKPATIPNPDILGQKLRIYLAAAHQSPEVSKKGVMPLTEEALARVEEVDGFVSATAGNEAFLSTSASATGAQLTKLQSIVISLIDQVLEAPYTELKSRFSKAKIGPCGGVPGRPQLAAPVGLEKAVENVFWVAQEVGLGQVQACYDLNKAVVTQTMGRFVFYRLPFEVKTYFQPSPQLDAGHISQFELEGGLKTGENGAILLSDKTISSISTYTTFNNSTLDLYIGSWYGDNHYQSETFECKSTQRFSFSMNKYQLCNSPVDSVLKRFDGEAVETISPDQRAAGIKLARSAVGDILDRILAARARAWNPLTLSWNEMPVPEALSGQPIQTGSELAAEQAEYSRLHLLSENLYLLGFYHGASVSDCLSILEKFSPEKMTSEIARKYVVEGRVDPQGDLLSSELRNETGRCKAAGMSQELVDLRFGLRKLLDEQQRSSD